MDLWGLGCCLFQMLVGKLPFEADTEFDVLQKIKKGEIHIQDDIKEEYPDATSLIENLL